MSVTNILGFSLSIAFCIYTLLYIFNELSYDKFHKDYNRIYRIVLEQADKQGEIQRDTQTHNPLAQALDDDMPEISDHIKLLLSLFDFPAYYKEEKKANLKVVFTGPNFFNFFSFKLIQGDKNNLLNDYNSIVLTESAAKKVFGNDDPIGKKLKLGNEFLIVTGVCEDAPINSHFSFDCLFSWTRYNRAYGQGWSSDWARINGLTYIKLAENANPEEIKNKLPKFTEKYLGDVMSKENRTIRFQLQPLHKIYLYSNLPNETKENNSILLIKILFYICAFLLIMSIFNYINFTLMVSTERAKEIGIRKINGSTRFQVFLNFLAESSIYNLISIIIVFIILAIALPFLNKTSGISITYNVFFTSLFWSIVCSLFIFNTIISVLYPTFILSNLNPITILKGQFINTKKGKTIRSILLTIQFIVAVFLLFGLFVINGQVSYFNKKDLGFDYRNNLLVNDGALEATLASTMYIRDELLKLPHIKDVAFARSTPGSKFKGTTAVSLEGQDFSHTMFMLQVGFDFPSFFNLKIIAGRMPCFEEFFANKVLLNRKAADMLKVKGYEELIGKVITQTLGNFVITKEIVGIVEDYHHFSLKEPIYPLVLNLPRVPGGNYCIKMDDNISKSEAMKIVKTFWETKYPEKEITYQWHEDYYTQAYMKDNQFKAMFDILNIIVIILIMTGTGSLSLLIMRQKTKDIAIHKLYGAKTFTIILYNSYYFILIATIAMIIALPIASHVFSGWLENFAFHIKLNFVYYLIPCLIIIAIILISVLLSTIKQIKSNFLERLKHE